MTQKVNGALGILMVFDGSRKNAGAVPEGRRRRSRNNSSFAGHASVVETLVQRRSDVMEVVEPSEAPEAEHPRNKIDKMASH